MLIGGLLVAGVFLTTPAPAQMPQKPNILFILVDNLGYGELGVYGGGTTRGAPTPRLDTLASKGLRLTNMNKAGSSSREGVRPSSVGTRWTMKHCEQTLRLCERSHADKAGRSRARRVWLRGIASADIAAP
jgi:hypothetical protein